MVECIFQVESTLRVLSPVRAWCAGQLGTAGMDVLIALQASHSAGGGPRAVSTTISGAYQQDTYSRRDCSVEVSDDSDQQPLLPHTTAT